MYLPTLIILLLLTATEYSFSVKIENEISRLKDIIFKNYDKYERPVNETTYLSVKMFLFINNIKIEDFDEDAYTINGHMIMNWFDKRLAWDKNKYFNKSSLMLPQDVIWQPSPVVVSYVKSSLVKIHDIVSTNEELSYCSSKGTVTVFYRFNIYLRNSCTSNFRMWPHDSKICKMSVAFPSTSGQNVTFTSLDKKLPRLYKNLFVGYKNLRDKQWTIYRVSALKKEKNESRFNEELLVVDFFLKRQGSLYSTFYLQPCLVILYITLAVFWMDPKLPERMVLIGLLQILQTILFTSMSVLVPSHGDQTPVIMLVCSLEFILTVILCVETILLKRMCSTCYNPSWLQSLTTWSVRNSIISHIFFLNINPKIAAELIEEDEESSLLIMKTKKLQKQWQIVTQILNLSIFILFIPISFYLTALYSLFM